MVDKENDDLITRKSILDQKKLRINNEVESHLKRIRELEIAKKNQDFEMNKLNDQKFQNKESRIKLLNANFNIEMEFKQKLKELENESVKLENQITQLKQEKSHILGEVVEAERQILLWDRKIQLEKEMQDTLDPTIGQKQIVAMKKEIHRMELQYNLYRKEQEKLIKDMERAVFKRETIQLKYMPKVEKKNAQDRSSQGKLSRQVANLKQNLKHTTENTMQLDTTIDAKRAEIQNVSNEIGMEKEQSQEQGNNLRQRQIEMLNKQIGLQKCLFDARSAKTQADRYAEIATGKYLTQLLPFKLKLTTPSSFRPIRSTNPS